MKPGLLLNLRSRTCFGLLILLSISACETAAQKAHNAELNRPASEEMHRICALHGEERAEELKKLKEQTGLELYCPDE